jgi:phosphatidylserine/phosphatidylglycerophosphate/cardiolipin synthase-like enzyme
LDKTKIAILKKAGRFEVVLLVAASVSLFLLLKPPVFQHAVTTPQFDVERVDIDGQTVFFDQDIEALNHSLVNSAKKSIKIATYTFSDSSFSRLLEKRSKEGIEVKVVAGKNKDNSSPGYRFSVIERDNGIVHPKFMVIDSKDVMITSSNMGSNLSSSSNSAVLFRDVPVVAEILEEEIASLFAGNIEKRCVQGCDTEIGTVYFTPGAACRSVRDEFIKAENQINGAVYTLTLRHPLITGLKKALGKGVKVSLIVDNWIGREGREVNKSAKRYLRSLGAEVDFDNDLLPGDPLFHHKFAVVDRKTTIFGSMNWTSSGCYRNREIVIVSRDPYIAKEFDEYFLSIK